MSLLFVSRRGACEERPTPLRPVTAAALPTRPRERNEVDLHRNTEGQAETKRAGSLVSLPLLVHPLNIFNINCSFNFFFFESGGAMPDNVDKKGHLFRMQTGAETLFVYC